MSDNFLSRWSRLKNQSKEAPPAEPVAEAPPAPPAEAAPSSATAAAVEELPPIDSLTAQSDFSAFLKDGVPDHLRRAALAKLWTSDPLFTRPEVFDLHMEDYNAHPLGEAVKTAWKVGKGIVERAEEAADCASFPENAENSQNNTPQEQDDASIS